MIFKIDLQRKNLQKKSSKTKNLQKRSSKKKIFNKDLQRKEIFNKDLPRKKDLQKKSSKKRKSSIKDLQPGVEFEPTLMVTFSFKSNALTTQPPGLA